MRRSRSSQAIPQRIRPHPIEPNGVAQLLGGPFRRRTCGDMEMEHAVSIGADTREIEKHLKRIVGTREKPTETRVLT
jgi:hypothetical protein